MLTDATQLHENAHVEKRQLIVRGPWALKECLPTMPLHFVDIEPGCCDYYYHTQHCCNLLLAASNWLIGGMRSYLLLPKITLSTARPRMSIYLVHTDPGLPYD